MKRDTCFIAMRDLYEVDGKIESSVPCGVFIFLDECEDKCGEWEQQAREKGLNVVFRPAISTLYG